MKKRLQKSQVPHSAGSCWRTQRIQREVLRSGLQRGMMGSNNHIITNRASALSGVRRIKRACRVHTRAASPWRCGTRSHDDMLRHIHKYLSAWWNSTVPSVFWKSASAWTHIAARLAATALLPLVFCQVRSEFTGLPWTAPESLATHRIAHSLSNSCIKWHETLRGIMCKSARGGISTEAAGMLEVCRLSAGRRKHT